MINAVMLGAIAGSGRLPIPADAFEAAIRADGKAVEATCAASAPGWRRRSERLPAPLPRPASGGRGRRSPI